MTIASLRPAVLLALVVTSSPARPGAQGPGTVEDMEHPQNTNAGIFAFTGHCAGCHDTGRNGATDRYALNRHTPEEVLAAITTGSMVEYARGLSEFQKRVVAVYVGGRPLGAAAAGDASQMKNVCATHPALQISAGSEWNGWGVDVGNTRYQTSPGLSAADTPRLKLKWAFGFPNGNSAYGQPTVVGGRVFVGSDTGFVYSLDAVSGCIHWSFRASAGVRTAISIGPGNGTHRLLAYFGDVKANVYAIDAETGEQVWKDRLDSHPVARVTGAPTLAGGRLYVPLSSLEESGAGHPSYPCCTFRGGLAAYDAVSGTRLWKSFTIPDVPEPTKPRLSSHRRRSESSSSGSRLGSARMMDRVHSSRIRLPARHGVPRPSPWRSSAISRKPSSRPPGAFPIRTTSSRSTVCTRP